MLVLSKLLPRSNNYIGISCRVSDNLYGGILEYLGGAFQGNVFSGNVCRDVSCLIFR